ncbi:MAG: UbiA-like polyprenyltransferase [Planctomycetota bacterium]
MQSEPVTTTNPSNPPAPGYRPGDSGAAGEGSSAGSAASVPTERAAGWAGKLGILARDIKLSHTVFALPFAVLGMVLAAGWAGRRVSGVEAGLVVGCMVLARTFAMSVNRVADAALDAANPRTAGRAVASGALSRRFAGGVIAATGAGFMLGTAGFWWAAGNRWPFVLAGPVLAVLAGYSFAKRFTWWCHVVLGLALGLSPLAAAVAIEPGYLAGSAAGWWLAGMVLCWVAGFDVIYALQDVGVDRKLGLFSMPASLGEERALWVSRGLHAGAAGCLAGAWWVSPQLGTWFGLALGGVAGLLVVEHALVWRSEARRIPLAFFTVNGVISLLLGAAGVADVYAG